MAAFAASSIVMGAAGLALVKEHEGLRTSAYIDPVGIPTICYGHTGPDVRMGLRYTPAQCEQVLLRDIQFHRAGMERCIKRPLTPNQRDAVVSFAFNVGVPKACSSTLVRHLNAGNDRAAAAEFPKWDKARVDGRLVALRGLTKRRAVEQALFLTPYKAPSERASLAATREILGEPSWGS